MCLDSELRYAMLEKACQDGDATMAECLIELGADINAKTKSESLIYQVGGWGHVYAFAKTCRITISSVVTADPSVARSARGGVPSSWWSCW